MRVALVLLAVVGCAKSAEKAANKEPASSTVGAPAGGGSATGEGEGGTATGSAAPAPQGGSVGNAHADEGPKGPPDQQAPLDQKSGGGGLVRGKGNGSGVDAARSGGMLGPSDQRAFVVKGKVSIKGHTSKDLAASVTAKLEDVQACYDKALEFKDTLAGEITIAVKAGKPTVAKSTVKNTELETCVIDVLKAASLPTGKSTLVLAFKRE